MAGESTVRSRSTRVAVICDFLEEQWPSMDLAGDMLCRYLAAQCGDDMTVTQMRPSMRQRFSRLPVLEKQLSWNADRLINRFSDYPAWLRRRTGEFDLFHVVDHSYAHLIHSLPPQRTVVTCHDLDTFRCLLEPERENRPRWFRMMARRILDGFRQAAHVFAVSAATRDELVRHRLFRTEQISVVPNGVHPSCSPQPDAAADVAAARLLANDSSALWLLNVGNTLPRKRLDVLLRVFAAVKREIPEARLIRVGGGFTAAHQQLASELNIAHAVLELPFLERNTLAALYRRATLLLHTAEAEGFGLPLIEAMACGCPVVASDVTVLREVGGLAAAYCSVADVPVWKETVVRLLHEKLQNQAAWTLRREKAIAHASRFSWADNARETARIYREVRADNRH